MRSIGTSSTAMMLAFSLGRVVGVDHLLEAARLVLHQHVGQQQRERLVADQLARAPHRVAEAERRLLAGEARGAGLRQVAATAASRSAVLLRSFSVTSSSNWRSKWSSITAFVAAGDEDEMLDAGLARLVDHVLDQRPVDHRQHLLGHRLGGGQEAGAETGDRENGFANRFHVGRIMRESGGSGHRGRCSLAATVGRTGPLDAFGRKLDGTSRMAHWRCISRSGRRRWGGEFSAMTGAAMLLALRCWPAPAEAAPRCRNTGSFEAWLAGFKQEAAAQGISRQAICGGARRRDLRSGHHPARQRAGRVPAELPAVRRPHDGGGPLSERAEAAEGRTRALLSRIEQQIRRAAARGGRAVGAGKRLRRLQGRHLPDHPLGRDAGLRLPALGVLPRPVDGRGADRRARRSAAGSDDRQLGGRAWADAVHAGGLFQARRRFRRRRPRRHDPQRAGRARLRRQPAQELRLADAASPGCRRCACRRRCRGRSPASTTSIRARNG